MLDSWAILAWIQNEPGATAVEEVLEEARGRATQASWSVINAGEVYYQLQRRQGQDVAERFWAEALSGRLPLQTIPATNARVRAAARLKGEFRVSYADAFAMALALELGQPLVTGDNEIRRAADRAGLELEWLG